MCIRGCLCGGEKSLEECLRNYAWKFRKGRLIIHHECLMLANGCAHYTAYITPDGDELIFVYPEVRSVIEKAISTGVDVVCKTRRHFLIN